VAEGRIIVVLEWKRHAEKSIARGAKCGPRQPVKGTIDNCKEKRWLRKGIRENPAQGGEALVEGKKRENGAFRGVENVEQGGKEVRGGKA